MVNLLNSPERLRQMGNNGHRWVRDHYDVDLIVDRWEKMFSVGSDQLDNASGSWEGPKTKRYRVERLLGKIGCGKILDIFLWLVRKEKVFS